MSIKPIQSNQNNSQSYLDFIRENLFISHNEFLNGVLFNPSETDVVNLESGMLVSRNASLNNLVLTDATNLDSICGIIFIDETTISPEEEINVKYCIRGFVDEDFLFFNGFNLGTFEGNKTVKDILQDIGIIPRTVNDNSVAFKDRENAMEPPSPPDITIPSTPTITSASKPNSRIVANLNGGDESSSNNELTFKVYGRSDDYTNPIITTGNADNDANVSVAGDVLTITNTTIGIEPYIKLATVDANGNESLISTVFEVDFDRMYVRPSTTPGTYGLEDGSSYANAWNGFSNIDEVACADKKLAIRGTHLEGLTPLVGGYVIEAIGDADNGVIDGENTRLTGVLIDNVNNIIINDLKVTKHTNSNIRVQGSSNNIITNDTEVSLSGDQGFQHFGTCVVVHNDALATDNADDGSSQHGDSVCTYNRGTYQNNGQGIAFVEQSNGTINGSTFINNSVEDIKSNSTTGTVIVNDVTTPNLVNINAGTATFNNCDINDLTSALGTTTNLYDSILRDTTSDCQGKVIFNNSLLLDIPIIRINDIEANDTRFTANADIRSDAFVGRRLLFNEGFAFNSSGTVDMAYIALKNSTSKNSCVFNNGSITVNKFDNVTIVGNGVDSKGMFLNASVSFTANNVIVTGVNRVDNNANITYNNSCFFNNLQAPQGVLVDEITTDPNLVDPSNLDFSLGLGSSCIGAGITASETEGIDTADWGDGSTTTPVVTTKNNTVPFDVGAYIS